MEAASSHLKVCVPVACGVIGLSGNGKAVEAVGPFTDVLGIELTFRGVYFQIGWMALRERLILIGHNSGNMEGVSGTPYSALSVNETLEAFGDGFTSNIKTAQRTLITTCYLKISCAAAGLCNHCKRLVGNREFGKALTVCTSLCKALKLEVKHFNLGSGNRLRGNKISGCHPNAVSIGILCHQAQVTGDKLHGREAVAVHVVGRLGRVVGLLPVVLFPVVVVVPVVTVGGVPDGFIGH